MDDAEARKYAEVVATLRDHGPQTEQGLAALMDKDETEVHWRLSVLANYPYGFVQQQDLDEKWEYVEPSAFRKAMWALQP